MLSHKNHETPHKAPHNNHANLHQQAVLPQPITTYKFTFHSEAKVIAIASRWPVGPSPLRELRSSQPPTAVFLRRCLVVRGQILSEGRPGMTSEPK
jgi:hypothetical protein